MSRRDDDLRDTGARFDDDSVLRDASHNVTSAEVFLGLSSDLVIIDRNLKAPPSSGGLEQLGQWCVELDSTKFEPLPEQPESAVPALSQSGRSLADYEIITVPDFSLEPVDDGLGTLRQQEKPVADDGRQQPLATERHVTQRACLPSSPSPGEGNQLFGRLWEAALPVLTKPSGGAPVQQPSSVREPGCCSSNCDDGSSLSRRSTISSVDETLFPGPPSSRDASPEPNTLEMDILAINDEREPMPMPVHLDHHHTFKTPRDQPFRSHADHAGGSGGNNSLAHRSNGHDGHGVKRRRTDDSNAGGGNGNGDEDEDDRPYDHNNNGGGGSGDAPDPSRTGQEQQQAQAQAQKRSFACPYLKFDPIRHKACNAHLLSKISYVKQHIKRSHRMPIHCARCMTIFGDEEARDQHLRDRGSQACEVRPAARFEGVSARTLQELSKRSDQKKSEEEQWFYIYTLIFPNAPKPRTPYVDPALSEDLADFSVFFEGQGAQTIRDHIHQNLPDPAVANSAAFSVDAITEKLREVFQGWLQVRGGQTGGGGVATSPDGGDTVVSSPSGAPGPSSAANASNTSPQDSVGLLLQAAGRDYGPESDVKDD